MRRYGVFLAGILALACCGVTESSYDTPTNYFSKMQTLKVNVFYEPGAEPFVGNFSSALPSPFKDRSYWDILEENLIAIFQGRSVTVQLPEALSAMTALPAQGKTVWTADAILNLWEQNRTSVSTETEGHFFVAFVDGYFSEDGTTANNQVIGVNVTGTPAIAIFKRVVESTGYSPTGGVPKFVEQSTLVHEIGHALGLVNNGVPVTTAHHDSANGAHCTNTACAMYYANEGLTAATAFAQQAITNQSFVLLKDECLNDTKAYTP